ncbi:MAG: 30S ribosomal protein S12 [Candidatus Nanoarchaeia archaeon]|nr:30S ribosomal protein S12 [Candidatus Nanoarchaeia archaeon]MDD5054063.1 30S ribosomal protein S12 [Candidatus Nanoarchaeia archaeon]MDD5499551.1 30S ribosomal protein S12 [Candidatus Nanoarchaeia archaeon]
MKKTRGLFAGKQLQKRREKFKYARRGSKEQAYGVWKKFDPLHGAPAAKGIVVKKKTVEKKQPHSGLIKCVSVQLVKNGKVVTAFVPGDGAIKHIDEHNEVVIERIGAPERGAKGDIPGVKFKVIKVGNKALTELRKKGAKEAAKK